MLSLGILAMALALNGCGKNSTTAKDKADSDSTAEAENVTVEVKESPKAVDLTSDELDEFTDLFDTDEYNGFLVTPFNSTADIDWDEVLYNGGGIAKEELSKSEKAAYLKAIGDTELCTDLTVITADSINKYMEDYAGVSFDKDSFDTNWTYLEKYDSYYFQRGDTNYEPFTCTEGKKLGDTYVLTFTSDWTEDDYTIHPDREVTVEKNGDVYKFVSNILLWEKGNDPEQTFDIDLSFEDKPCKFITYQGSTANDKAAEMVITCDGKKIDWLSTSLYDEYDDSEIEIRTVAAVGIFDFNADALTDIVVVADCSDSKRHMFLYESTREAYTDEITYYFRLLQDSSQWLDGFVTGDLTIPNIKASLLGDNTSGTYDTWKDAYLQITKIDNCQGDMRYSLVYIDNDDIPELVADDLGYNIEIYSFKNGHAVPVSDYLSYGISGNGGYEYAPNKNCIRYWSTDYAGLISYLNFMSVHDDMLINDYTVISNNYDDLNGNGEPDDNETTDKALENAKGSVTYESSDKKLSQSDIKNKVDAFDSYAFQALAGEYEYTTFVDYIDTF